MMNEMNYNIFDTVDEINKMISKLEGYSISIEISMIDGETKTYVNPILNIKVFRKTLKYLVLTNIADTETNSISQYNVRDIKKICFFANKGEDQRMVSYFISRNDEHSIYQDLNTNTAQWILDIIRTLKFNLPDMYAFKFKLGDKEYVFFMHYCIKNRDGDHLDKVYSKGVFKILDDRIIMSNLYPVYEDQVLFSTENDVVIKEDTEYKISLIGPSDYLIPIEFY